MKTPILKIFFAAFWIVITQFTPLMGQTFTTLERAQGYAHRNDTTYFVFDAELYAKNPKKVVVTGAFRAWSTDMEDATFALQSNGNPKVWAVPVYNEGLVKVKPSSPFKFRVDEGEWLSPPNNTPNAEGGNLVFFKGVKPDAMYAEIRSANTIWINFEGKDIQRSLNPADYRVSNVRDEEVLIAEVFPVGAKDAMIYLKDSLNVWKNFKVEFKKGKPLYAWATHEHFFRTLYSNKDLGANVSADKKTTDFRIFVPRADGVTLNLYKNENDAEAYQKVAMVADENRVWEASFAQDLKGVYYDFRIQGVEIPGQPDDVIVSDPYGRVSIDSFGKSRVWYRGIPATPLKNGIPKMEDVVAYEVHIQDFTDQLPVPQNLKGTIPAFHKSGLKNSLGEPIGFDFLTGLGFNTLHLMPMQEYLNYPDDVWQKAFKDDPFMASQGVNLENYDWGYRTTHAFAVETRFREHGTEHGAQRDQFKGLVQSFHDKNIAVIVDYVFNHTGENMEGLHHIMNFNGIDMTYFYRTKNFIHIGEYGNETKSEHRPMMQRWIIDQVKHFIEEFGIDGIRIDLAWQTDEQTLHKLRQAIGEDKIVYGEPWIGSNDPNYENNPDWDWYKTDSPITFFQDDARNAFKGPTSAPRNKATDRGYAGGNTAEREKTMMGLVNSYPEEMHPNRGINYLDIHDNWTLADQFANFEWDGRKGVDEGAFKIAATLLFTSLGPIVLNGGTEIMRSKGIAPDFPSQIIKRTGMSPIYIKGRGDTYNLRTPNQYVWENVGKTKRSRGSYADYKGMQAFWSGLMKFRLSEEGKVFRVGMQQRDNYFRFITPNNAHLLGYFVDEKVFVLINTDARNQSFEHIAVPDGNWQLIANDYKVDMNGVEAPYRYLQGGKDHNFVMPAKSVRIWIRK